MRRRLVLLCFVFATCCCANLRADAEYYPDYYVHKPGLELSNEETPQRLAKTLDILTKLIESRRRLEEEEKVDFHLKTLQHPSKDAETFAVPPSDPRFYENYPDPKYVSRTSEKVPDSVNEVVKTDSTEEDKRNPAGGLGYTNDRILQNLHQHKDTIRADGDSEEFFQRTGDTSIQVEPISPGQRIQDDSAGMYVIAMVAGVSAAATIALIAVALGWYNLQKNMKSASDVEYPAYGVTGPNKEVSPSGDRKLAQSAQMYHYQHQKQQIIAMERAAAAAAGERHGSISELDSDEENEEGDYTVYECPGLAPTGEMEVKNPLFQDDPTPANAVPQPKETAAKPGQEK